MGREERQDVEGNLYHLVNRGAARRTILEHKGDRRFFESRLAHAVRRGEIEVLAFSLMSNHFHLLIRSRGGMSEAMRRIEGEHARYFNAARKRTGPLFTGRFRSFHVDNQPYAYNAYNYIDENALAQPGVDRPEQWPWGSAYLFAKTRPPRWLSREIVDLLQIDYGQGGAPVADPATRRARRSLVEARMSRRFDGKDPLADVLSGVSERVWQWMLSCAALADGTRPGIPIAGVHTVRLAVKALPRDLAELRLELQNVNRRTFEPVLLAGLLRDACGATFETIGKILRRSPATARRLHALHGRALRECEDYGVVARNLVELCVAPLREPRRRPTSDR